MYAGMDGCVRRLNNFREGRVPVATVRIALKTAMTGIEEILEYHQISKGNAGLSNGRREC